MSTLARRARHWTAAALTSAAAGLAAVAATAEAPAPRSDGREGPTGAELAPTTPLELGTYAHLVGAASIGRGIRFNNPFRLATPLGNTGESLSLSATYFDLGVGAAFGNPDGLLHGGALSLSVALDGIPQEALTPAYLALYRPAPRWLLLGRAGVPLVLEPDFNAGLELAAGGAWFFTSGIALTGQVLYDLFYGAATRQVSHTIIPVLSMQLGVLVDYEVLP